MHLQVDINTTHYNIRKILIENQAQTDTLNQNSKNVILFISLFEMLEMALANVFDYEKLDRKFDDYQIVLKTYQKLAYNLASTLKKIAKSIEQKKQYVPKYSLSEDLDAFKMCIKEYEKKLGKQKASEGVLMLTTMLHYIEEQVRKIRTIEKTLELKIKPSKVKEKVKNIEKFNVSQYYSWSRMVEHFNFSSPIFRHTIRLIVTIFTGLALAQIFSFQKPYWILMTIIVIMRPGFGLTQSRSYDRILGTIAGGLIAFGVIILIENHIIISLFTIIAMLLGFYFASINYKLSAFFSTIYVVFIYSIITPDVRSVIHFRILDTLVGGVLAWLANYFLWPTWEFFNVPAYLKKSILANKNYLQEIGVYYNKKGNVSDNYRSARKNAFIEIGNLMASLQRMAQEPKSKQKVAPKVYKLAVLNHTLLSSIASMGTYIQSHPTTSASKDFNSAISQISENLDEATRLISKKDDEIMNQNVVLKQNISKRFLKMRNSKYKEFKNSDKKNKKQLVLEMQEIQLITEQLVWVTTLSEKILKETNQLVL